jgi:hypothetical protein
MGLYRWAQLAGCFTAGIAVGIFVYSHQTKSNDQNRAEISHSVADPPIAQQTQEGTPACPVCPICKQGVSTLERLPPPEFSPKLGAEMRSNLEGEVLVEWLPVENAKRYKLVVTDGTGHHVRVRGVARTRIYLKDLPRPASEDSIDYWVTLASVNADEIEGEPSEKRKIVVRGRPDLRAPKIKTIQIED